MRQGLAQDRNQPLRREGDSPGKELSVKRKSPRKLQLNVETLTRLNLEEVVGGETRTCGTFSAAYTNCPMCGQTNYISCLNC